MSAAQLVAERVRCLVSSLDCTDLSPRPVVDAAFEELVAIALDHRGADAEQVLAALGPDLGRVRRLCALGESALERHWADAIGSAPDPLSELRRFPYTRNYECLVDLELAIVRGLGAQVRRVAVIGSGPLPLTGIVLACRHDLDVLLVDRDPEALGAGAAVVEALGPADRMASVRADVGRDTLDLRAVDLVVFGALVGTDAAEKHAMLGLVSAAMTRGAYLLVRSAAGLRELLYPRAAVDGVAGLTMLLEAHPHHEVVNSVLVARRN